MCAEGAVRGAAIAIAESGAQHIFGWVAIATIAPLLGRESLDSTNQHVEVAMELKRCRVDRIALANRQAGRCPNDARISGAREPSPARKYVAPTRPDPPQMAPIFDGAQHSFERNIGRRRRCHLHSCVNLSL